jgi:hypothetical protein
VKTSRIYWERHDLRHDIVSTGSAGFQPANDWGRAHQVMADTMAAKVCRLEAGAPSRYDVTPAIARELSTGTP